MNAVEKMTLRSAASMIKRDAEDLKARLTLDGIWPEGRSAEKDYHEAAYTIAAHLLEIANKYP